MSLRSRLVAGFVLVALVLVGADAVVGLLVHRSLIQSVDQRLAVARRPPRNDVAPPGSANGFPLGTATPDPTRFRFPALTDLYVAVVLADGTVDRQSPTATTHSPAPPAIPADLAKRASAEGA